MQPVVSGLPNHGLMAGSYAPCVLGISIFWNMGPSPWTTSPIYHTPDLYKMPKMDTRDRSA